MEIKFPYRGNLLKLAGLFLSLLILSFSCTQKENISVNSSIRTTLQRIIDQGELLKNISSQNKTYLFQFENTKLQISKAEIKHIKKQPEQWQTIITFVDKTQIKVPTLGTSLDFIIKNIKLNPSGYNPLAAKVEVNLPTYGRVRVTVHGKKGSTGSISHLFHSTTPHQTVPILGLYPNYNNIIDLDFTDKEGHFRGSTQIKIQTQPLEFAAKPQFNLRKSKPEKMEPGVNLINYPGISKLDVSIPYMVDYQGNIRWILLLSSSPTLGQISISSALKRTPEGLFIAGDQHQQRIVTFDLFGNLVDQWNLEKLGYSFHHDITIAKNGNFLITVTKNSARLANGRPRVMDHIIELDPEGGTIVNEWDLADIVDTSRYLKPDGITPPQFAQNPTNWAHNNSIIEFNGNLLATMRYQGIIGFSRAGDLQWIISPHKYWSKTYQPYLLQPITKSGQLITDSAVIRGETSVPGFDWPWGPHTPVALSDDRILIFDNGYNRHWVNNALTPNNNYSRAVEYKINTDDMTVQQLWSYGKGRGPGGFSVALSGVQYLPKTGHILFCPGMGVPTSQGRGGKIIEINPRTNKTVFELEITTPSNTAFHRVTRMSLYPKSL